MQGVLVDHSLGLLEYVDHLVAHRRRLTVRLRGRQPARMYTHRYMYMCRSYICDVIMLWPMAYTQNCP